MSKIPRSRNGQVPMVNLRSGSFTALDWAAVAGCQCGLASYTGVAGTREKAERIVARKHRKHLRTCRQQAARAERYPVLSEPAGPS
jgi:hypothetical protein